MKRLLLPVVVLCCGVAANAAGEIEFVETFALAPDREAALRQLVPGTEEYYYWNSLHLLNTEQFEKVDEFLVPWVQRFGETPRVWEIRTRKALLTYDRNPQGSLDYLRNRFGIHYPHRKDELNAEPNLPTVLDPNIVSRAAYQQQALARNGNSLNGFEDASLDWLVAVELNPDQRRQLLSRLTRPDYENLAALVAADLQHANSGGFGSLPIHSRMLLSQLDDLLKLRPELLNHQQFVRAYLTKLQPSPDVDWRRDPDELQKYLHRLQQFAERLDPVHNSLKAHVLYHQLVLDQKRGIADKNRFLAYVRLPRPVPYVSKAMQDSETMRRFPCDLNSNYDGATLLPPIGNDEPLVRGYLSRFFVEAKGTQEFEPFVNDVYLRHLFAETKIVHGLGEPEQWASLLPPELFRRLKDRVDLDFDPANKTDFAVDDPIQLDVHVKNVSTLLVKVYEINAKNFYRHNGREIDTDVNLDGLAANVEQSHRYDDAPFRRVRRRFEFPMLDRPGVYVIDFIGNGQSSRALIRKGHLKHVVRTTAAGQAFTVLDERGRHVKNAALWLGGREYQADEAGEILVPFSTSPGRQPIVLTAPVPGKAGAAYSSLAFFQHEAETYRFTAGIYVDREALLARKKAELLIRPSLSVNGTPVSLKLLEDVRLTIRSTDLDGVSSTLDVPGVTLSEDRDTIQEFQVPTRLASLNVRLAAKVTQATTKAKLDVATEETFTLNGIDRTEKVEDLHLLRAAGAYVLELRGRTGEAKASRPVSFQFKHRDFKDAVAAVLKTDVEGRISLGALDGVAAVTATGPEGTSHTWTLRGDRHTYPQTVHSAVGEAITLPYLGRQDRPTRDEFSLLEVRGGSYAADRFDHLALQGGLIVIDRLPAGDYDLLLKTIDAQVTIRVAEGERVGRFVVGSLRQLETKPLEPLQIASIAAGEDKVRIELRNVSPFARVHVIATRYVPAYDVFALLGRVRGVEPYAFRYSPALSAYLTGRNIGDEYRYIIERRYSRKFPGNMLERPSLLLNPWAVRETETGEQIAQGGEAFGARGEKGEAEAQRKLAEDAAGRAAEEHVFANLDFLATPSVALLNLAPDENGVVEISRDAFAGHQHVHVVAVDPLHTTCRSATLPEDKPIFLDLRLAKGLDPAGHFTRQKQVSIVAAGQRFTLDDIGTAQFEAYDSLGSVYALYSTLSKDPKWAEFRFIVDWPKRTPEEKRSLYSKYACHELSFFLSQKDPEFFRDVVKPYLANKRDKTFLDRYLLGDDLADWLQPWKYGQLNVVERILLARRIEEERGRTARHLADLLALVPPDVDRFNQLFDTATQGGALATSDAYGFKEALKELEARNGVATGGVALAAPAPPAGAGLAAEAKKQMNRQIEQLEKAKADALSRSSKMRAGRMAGADKAADEKSESSALFFEDVARKREALRQLFRKPDKTWEWAENNYYRLTVDQQTAGLISVNAFWRDFAAHDPANPFLSKHLAEASRNFSEMMLALAVLDLPFEAPRHETKFDGPQMSLVAGGPVVVFHEEIKPAAPPEGAAKVLVSQNFFRYGDRQRLENGETVDHFVTDEFLIHAVYGCQIVLTNPTATRQKLSVLVQIPRGALPVLNSQATRTLHVQLEPYHTQTLEYHFYFPAAGEFPQFPVHVSKNERLIAAAAPFTMTVVDRPTKIDKGSWEYVSQHGSLEEVTAFLNDHNVNALNLDRIAWRMHDRAAFEAVLPLLARRHVYHHTLWSYALLHQSVAAANEFLQHADNIVNEAGGRLKSPLLTIDPVLRGTYEHLEYRPLVNARAHALGQRRKIVNERVLWQYHRLLKDLAYQNSLTDEAHLAVTYYLLLQDRIEDALAAFAKVNRDNVAEKLQYDYCAAYVKFFSDEPEAARAIVAKYAEHPVDRWRKTFAAIGAQLDEAAGRQVAAIDPESREQQQGELAATEPSFDFTVEARKITLNYRRLQTLVVNFYVMDVELLFSRNPFVQQAGGEFASIKPHTTLTVTLNPDASSHIVDIPAELRNSNVLIEAVGAGETKTQPYFSSSLSVQVIETYGQLAVTHAETKKPVSKAYVKVYARTATGEVKFYKDGYTDLRGRFDFASLNTNDLDVAEKFAILILSDEHGAVVREAVPPKR